MWKTVEYVVFESEEPRMPHPRAFRQRHAVVELRNRLRLSALRMEIVDFHYLVVRLRRGARSRPIEYVLDLRFVDPAPRVTRTLAEGWIAAALALLACAAAIALMTGGLAAPSGWLRACAALSVLGLGTGLVWLCRVSESVTLTSAHGRATLLSFTGGLGSLALAHPFLKKLTAHIQLSLAERRSSSGERLRDEMREHFRLCEIGVLAAEAYEAGKSRILAQHDASVARIARLTL